MNVAKDFRFNRWRSVTLRHDSIRIIEIICHNRFRQRGLADSSSCLFPYAPEAQSLFAQQGHIRHVAAMVLLQEVGEARSKH